MAAFAPSGFAVLRTPFLPFDELVRWGDGRDAREALRALVERPEVREAIFVAASSLVDTWLENPDSERGAQCERALVRYLARMAGRSTPFGLFAGVSTLPLGERTNLVLGARDEYRRTTRLDAGYLVDVLSGLLEQPDYRERLSYTPNRSLYRCGDRRRYVHSRPAAEEDRHLLVSVRESATLAAVLDASAEGKTPAELRAALVEAGHDEERVRRYVEDLIEQQVLVPNVDLKVTGGDAVYGLAEAEPTLAAVRTQVARLDEAAPGADTARYREIVSELEHLPAELNPDKLFQVDMTKPAPDATLGRDVTDEILRGVELLWRIGRDEADPSGLERFAERLTARYEGTPAPLLEALDPDVGVGFDETPPPAPLVAGLAGRDGNPTASWGAREQHLLTRVLELQAEGRDELVLGPRDLERLDREDRRPLPDAFAAVASVAGSPMSGRFRVYVHGVDGPSGARLLGRFCHTDTRLQSLVEEHLRAEEAHDPDAVFAEIVHLPRARDANVVARPVLREHELVCLGGSGADRKSVV